MSKQSRTLCKAQPCTGSTAAPPTWRARVNTTHTSDDRLVILGLFDFVSLEVFMGSERRVGSTVLGYVTHQNARVLR